MLQNLSKEIGSLQANRVEVLIENGILEYNDLR